MFEHIPGGRAAGKPYRVFRDAQLRLGTKVEKEHTGNPSVAKEIASDHLAEIPDYYTRLKKMEDAAPKVASAHGLLRASASGLGRIGRALANSADDIVLMIMAKHRRNKDKKGKRPHRMHTKHAMDMIKEAANKLKKMKESQKRDYGHAGDTLFGTGVGASVAGGIGGGIAGNSMMRKATKPEDMVNVHDTLAKHLKAHGDDISNYDIVMDHPEVKHPNAAYLHPMHMKNKRPGVKGAFLFANPTHHEYVIAHEVGHSQPSVLRKVLMPLNIIGRTPLGLGSMAGGGALVYSGLKDTREGRKGNHGDAKMVGGMAAIGLPGAGVFAEEARANYNAVKSLKAVGSKVPKGIIARQMLNYGLPMLGVPAAIGGATFYLRRKMKARRAAELKGK